MKIRARLRLNAWISLGAVILMMFSLAWSFWKIDRTDRNEILVGEMRKAAFERILLRDEYLLYQEERAGTQWHAKSEILRGLLESGPEYFTSKKDKALLQDARKDFDATVSGFSTILEKYKREKRSVGKNLAFDEADSRLIGQTFLKAYALQDSINRLYESTEMEAVTTRNRGFILIIFFVLGGGVAIFLNSIVAGRIVTRGVTKLHEGVGIIGSGNLDYRIDATGGDELSDLARASNEMAAKLKKSYTSVENLQKEIIERKRVEEEREKLIKDLQEALASVKQLSGLLPICSSCKKVRDDKGYWNQIEVYIRDHSETEFTHGICPECFKKLYPDESLEDL
jgi:methyl-accepting chemotaxis protein